MGKWPVSLVKSLLSSLVTTKLWLDGVATGGGRTARGTSKVMLGITYPSPMKPIPGTPPLPITQILTSNRSSLTWADRVRIPVTTK